MDRNGQMCTFLKIENARRRICCVMHPATYKICNLLRSKVCIKCKIAHSECKSIARATINVYICRRICDVICI